MKSRFARLVFSLIVLADALLGPLPSAALAEPPALPVLIDEIRIHKNDHTLELVSDGVVAKTYRVAIGPGGSGPKRWQGDAVTPVGRYRIVGRIAGLYHQFLTLDYPNEDDRRRYAALKKDGIVPKGRGVGYGVGIHGTGHPGWNGVHKDHDWTLGCIALDDDEIDEIAARVKDGTAVVIDD